MFAEEDLLPISALQHYIFCPRQCALIHVEQVWSDNVLTVQGSLLHSKVHASGSEARGDLIVMRGMRIRSLRLGLIGQADAVEFVRCSMEEDGVRLADRHGHWRPSVIEYKRGRPKIDRCDEVQLCAQVMCMEEMLGVEIFEAAIFYGDPRRRYRVSINKSLRIETTDAIVAVRALLESSLLPVAVDDKRCRRCSLLDQCQPGITSRKRSAAAYLKAAVKEQCG